MGELYSGVEDRFLFGVEPSGWLPFGEAVRIEVAGPAFGEKVVVVVATQKGEIVEIRFTAVDPFDNVVESAWDAVPWLPWVCFPRPLSEPDVRLSPHPALHEVTPAG
jgi:hypothetical protein